MDQITTNQNNLNPQPKDAFQQDIGRLKSLVTKIKEGIKQRRETLKQNAQAAPKPSLKGLISGNKKIALLVAILLLLVLLVIAGSLYQVFTRKGSIVVKPSPTPAATETAIPQEITRPSKYATDSAVLEIEKMVEDLDRNMSTVDIREAQLTPPNLDYEVKF